MVIERPRLVVQGHETHIGRGDVLGERQTSIEGDRPCEHRRRELVEGEVAVAVAHRELEITVEIQPPRLETIDYEVVSLVELVEIEPELCDHVTTGDAVPAIGEDHTTDIGEHDVDHRVS